MVITHIKKHGSYYNINYGEKFIPQDSFIYKKDIEEFLASGGEIEEEVIAETDQSSQEGEGE